MRHGRILIFAKFPRPGQVKTRLAQEIGESKAAKLAGHFLEATLANLRGLKPEIEICCAPDESLPEFQTWLGPGYLYSPQGPGDLGERLGRGFARVFAQGLKRALAIASDTPDLPPSFLSQAFASLRGHDSVLGPCADGGYYLLGMRRESFEPRAFLGIDWGGDQVFKQTYEILKNCGHQVRLLSTWRDIDGLDDLKDYLGKVPQAAKLLD